MGMVKNLESKLELEPLDGVEIDKALWKWERGQILKLDTRNLLRRQ